jgi:hypothetical protein
MRGIDMRKNLNGWLLRSTREIDLKARWAATEIKLDSLPSNRNRGIAA